MRCERIALPAELQPQGINRLFYQRQCYSENGPLSSVVSIYRTKVIEDNTVRNREAKTGALIFSCEKRFEDLR